MYTSGVRKARRWWWQMEDGRCVKLFQVKGACLLVFHMVDFLHSRTFSSLLVLTEIVHDYICIAIFNHEQYYHLLPIRQANALSYDLPHTQDDNILPGRACETPPRHPTWNTHDVFYGPRHAGTDTQRKHQSLTCSPGRAAEPDPYSCLVRRSTKDQSHSRRDSVVSSISSAPLYKPPALPRKRTYLPRRQHVCVRYLGRGVPKCCHPLARAQHRARRASANPHGLDRGLDGGLRC